MTKGQIIELAILDSLRKECNDKSISYTEEDSSADLCAKLNT